MGSTYYYYFPHHVRHVVKFALISVEADIVGNLHLAHGIQHSGRRNTAQTLLDVCEGGEEKEGIVLLGNLRLEEIVKTEHAAGAPRS